MSLPSVGLFPPWPLCCEAASWSSRNMVRLLYCALLTLSLTSTMPTRPSRPAKKLSSSKVRVYSGLGTSKVMKVSQVQERQKRLEEKKKNEELREFQLCSWTIF